MTGDIPQYFKECLNDDKGFLLSVICLKTEIFFYKPVQTKSMQPD